MVISHLDGGQMLGFKDAFRRRAVLTDDRIASLEKKIALHGLRGPGF